jgi:Domain of unknown function (DUF4126)
VESAVEILMALALGVALAAAAGLRVFVPLLVVSLAAYFGKLELAPSFEWLASLPAVATFAAAAAVEIAAYYVPGLDHLLDLVLTPLALVAGVVLMAVPLGDLPPLLRWSIALIAGGGAAGVTQASSALIRAKSATATGGLGNPVVATGELGGSVMLSAVALLFPVVALLLVVLLVWFVVGIRRQAARRGKG